MRLAIGLDASHRTGDISIAVDDVVSINDDSRNRRHTKTPGVRDALIGRSKLLCLFAVVIVQTLMHDRGGLAWI
ncbi:Uncharacterised protein [Burkholderia pseudomallei]|nr:Uncharacterised protein [Burkholderia pseudomallei]